MNEKIRIKTGIGYDVHKLVKERKLILAGVEIPHILGLSGHSDADVLTHAIMDGLLGAMALGDIGHHFPDTDKKYKNISSLFLLKEVKKLLDKNEVKIQHIDSIVVAEKPKIAPYIDVMKKNLQEILEIPINCINIKATTTEGLGFEGREEGISAQAIVTVTSPLNE